jgi:hypothetical protein
MLPLDWFGRVPNVSEGFRESHARGLFLQRAGVSPVSRLNTVESAVERRN